VGFDWDVEEAGADVMHQHGGNPLPDHVIDSIRRNTVAIKGPITTPVGSGFRSVNVGLRKALDLYAQVRPCKLYPGVRTRYADTPVDLVIVRENTEDLYAGIEYEAGSEQAAAVIEIGLIEMPASRCRSVPPFDSIQLISSSASGVPCSYSMPA